MPLISTNDSELHRKLKIWVAARPGKTIGSTVEDFVKFGLKINLGDLTDEQKEALAEEIIKLRN